MNKTHTTAEETEHYLLACKVRQALRDEAKVIEESDSLTAQRLRLTVSQLTDDEAVRLRQIILEIE